MGNGGALSGLFVDAALDAPAETAVVVGGSRVTYSELAGSVERTVDSMVAGGVGDGSVVVSESLGASAIATVIAASHLGATFVPSSPGAESAGLAARVSASHILSNSSEQGRPPHIHTIPGVGDANVVQEKAIEGAEYVILTSGSVRRPKAVPISSTNLASLIEGLSSRRRLPAGARIALTYQPTFDPFYYVLIQSWLARGTVVIPEGQEHLLVSKFVADYDITCWDSVPFLAKFASRAGCLEMDSMPAMQHATFGGEPLAQEVVDMWRRAAPNSEIVNSYGPTEMTISCLDANVESIEGWSEESSMPVGEPFDGVEVRLVGLPDHDLGDVFELCLRGRQRFSGYVDEADNVGRFVDDGGVELGAGEIINAAHWYRTGDLVRQTSEGLVVVGRANSQLKVRGYRVDLDEVRQALLDCGVSDAWVDVVDDRIVAVVEGDHNIHAGRTIPGLRSYAVPQQIVRLDALPRSDSGKVSASNLRSLFGPASS